mmetsp:Transcript_49782/g.118679  ORF Transcript_49782/g.118679 Transcript_49782/m.118679 type:complete len:104 (+) Transcript_49782:1494-1805(+)
MIQVLQIVRINENLTTQPQDFYQSHLEQTSVSARAGLVMAQEELESPRAPPTPPVHCVCKRQWYQSQTPNNKAEAHIAQALQVCILIRHEQNRQHNYQMDGGT